MPNVSREEFDEKQATQDECIRYLVIAVSRIEGKLDQQNSSWQWLGVISAVILGLWNMLK